MEQRGEMTRLLIDTFKDAIDYNNFLYSNEIESIDINAQRLKLMYASEAITIWKDNYITKKEDNMYLSCLIDGCLENYVKNIAEKIDDKFYIGTIEFESPIHVVEFIRNKLAHGDFTIVGDKIKIQRYISKDKINKEILFGEGYVDIKHIITLATDLSFNWRKNIKYGNNESALVFNNNHSFKNNKIIKSKKDLINHIKNIYLIKINENPKVVLQFRDNKYINDVNKVIAEFKNHLQLCKSKEELNELVNHIKDYANFYGINLKIEIINGMDINGVDKLMNICLKDKDVFMKANVNYQHYILCNYLYDLGVNNVSKLDISKGILTNLYYLNYLENKPDASLREIINFGVKNNIRPIGNEHDKAIISSYLTSFYIIYVYGLERIYTGKEEQKDTLKGLFNLELFNFAELDLSTIKPKVNVIEHEYDYFKDELISMISKTLDKSLLEKTYKDYEAFKSNVHELNSDKLIRADKMYQDKIKNLEDTYEYNKVAVVALYDFMHNQFETYKYNRAIIEHIRNAIVHGNVFVDMLSGSLDVLDTVITFKDIYNGEVTFELEVTTKEFLCLLNNGNLNMLNNYLKYNLPEQQDEKRLTL